MKRPKISVVSIAKNAAELQKLSEALKTQKFKDFEFVIHTGGTIPEAWNNAISKAKGEYIVFTESDAIPLNDQWLHEISLIAKKNTLIKGVEINPTPLDLCNLVVDGDILKEFKFDEDFKIAEDVELFARLRRSGLKIEFANAFPVIHTPTKSWKKSVPRSFFNGLYFMKIIYLHGQEHMDNVNTMAFQTNYINPISRRLLSIVEQILTLLGLIVGMVVYLPVLIKNKLRRS